MSKLSLPSSIATIQLKNLIKSQVESDNEDSLEDDNQLTLALGED
jgi:hypothetical protein